MAAGEQLKFEEVSAREAAALAVDKAAWRALGYNYKSLRLWLEYTQSRRGGMATRRDGGTRSCTYIFDGGESGVGEGRLFGW